MGAEASARPVEPRRHSIEDDDDSDSDETKEKHAWEEMKKIKALSIPMAQKKLLKAQLTELTTISMLELKGCQLLRWRFSKAFARWKTGWKYRRRNAVLFQKQLQTIEVKCGTSIVNVFLFIKWTFFLNVAMFLITGVFIILPIATDRLFRYGKSNLNYDVNPTTCPADTSQPNNVTFFGDANELMKCCMYSFKESLRTERSTISIIHFIQESLKLKKSLLGNVFFYGFYETRIIHTNYNFRLAYVLVTIGIFLSSLVLMVRSIGKGVTDMILAREGEFYKYSNLIFGGWDHYTSDEAGAQFKRKIMLNEIKITLQAEIHKEEVLMRSRRQHVQLKFNRLLVNLFVILLWGIVGGLIYLTTNNSLTGVRTISPSDSLEKQFSYFLQTFAPSLIMTISNLIFPIILARFERFEKYPAEIQITLMLLRCLFVRLMNIGLAAYSFFNTSYCSIKPNHCTLCLHDIGLAVRKRGSNRVPCWESLVCEHIYILIITDFILKVAITFIWEPTRVFIGKKIKSNLCQKFAQIRFNIVRHSLDIISIQVLSWLGFYFSPVLPGIVAIYCILIFFIKKFSVLHNCNAVPDTFKTTRTSTIFIFTKFFSFIAVAIIMVFVVGSMNPSRGCGPFATQPTPWHVVHLLLSESVPLVRRAVDTIVSPGIITPILICVFLGSYYYYSVTVSNREMVETLRHLIVLEGHDKRYLFARLDALKGRKSTANL